MPEKKAAEQVFNPTKYHMNFCHACQGLGKTLHNENSINRQDSMKVCPVCGGFGFIKNGESGFKKTGGT